MRIMVASKNRTEVLVIGAGPAGLATGQALRHEKDVMCLEATSRFGGRIRANEDDVEMGAQAIHSKHFLPFLQKLGLSYSAYDEYENTYVFNEGDIEPSMEEPGPNRTESIIVELRQLISTILQPSSSQKLVPMSLEKFIEEFLLRYDASLRKRVARNQSLVYNGIRTECGTELHQLSLPGFLESNSYDKQDYMITGGMSALPRALSEGLDVRKKTPALTIERKEDSIMVDTPRGIFSAKQAVIAVPLGVLQKGLIQFSPELPQSVEQAIHSLGNAAVHKIVSVFSQRFWPHDMSMLRTHFPDAPVFYPTQVRDGFALTCLVGGRPAHRMAHAQESDVFAVQMERLSQIYGPAAQPLLIRQSMVPWFAKKWTSTGYTTLCPGQENLRHLLSEPIDNRLFLAGDYCIPNRYASTVIGACESGEAQAARILS
jgi:monoamine oxidase